MRRPYEQVRGDAEAAYEESLTDLCHTIETTTVEPGEQLAALEQAMLRARDRFRKIDARREREQPLIGIVGEIFCRLNTFSNENLIGSLEQYGAEAWLSDIVEWVWYTNSELFRKLKLENRIWSLEALGAWVRQRVQKHDEHRLVEVFHEDFAGREEPDIYEILECRRRRRGALRGSGRAGAGAGRGYAGPGYRRGRDRHRRVGSRGWVGPRGCGGSRGCGRVGRVGGGDAGGGGECARAAAAVAGQ